MNRPHRVPKPRSVVFVTYEDASGLDLTGPFEVFAQATSMLRDSGSRHPGYAITVLSPNDGPVRASSGLRIVPDTSLARFRGPIDTLIVTGGKGRRQASNEAMLAWLAKWAPRARRYGSVCTGAFLLAAAGLLDGRRVTTHWNRTAQLAQEHPLVHVEAERIFVKDGNVFSSAGVSAGMDLALALVEDDAGPELALAIARYLVMYLRRPGDQSQFSAPLRLQRAKAPTVRDLISWATENPAEDLSVPALARRIGMSERQLSRVFKIEIGESPARAIEALRVEAAEHALASSRASLDEVASKTGFRSAEVMRRAFMRIAHVNPSVYRARFGAASRSVPREESVS
ncbi:GlxA family transcriptional regulator [Pendulispora albinea]|uniref:DJ-1/PfpI family protein n=1 Tax=Pendulispora albinea TaxID=2741071 RepID=A0ABZ2LZJ9_9BACT